MFGVMHQTIHAMETQRLSRLSTGRTSLLSLPVLPKFRPVVRPSHVSVHTRQAPQLIARALAEPPVPASSDDPDMFCYQCEQALNTEGCTTRGVCGKTSETAALQDLLIYQLKVSGTDVAAVGSYGKAPSNAFNELMVHIGVTYW
jgi:hypothetical protein